MATYAIGDIQGCYQSLLRLTQAIGFDPQRDRLWFAGDLVNRGPGSLLVLRYIKSLGPAAIAVLGNHDLFLLAVAAGLTPLRPKDTLGPILDAPDRDELMTWLRHRPLLHREDNVVMVHAGLLPQWSVREAAELAGEVEAALRGDDYVTTLRALHPSAALQWHSDLTGPIRLASIAKGLTRLRTCTEQGLMESNFSGPPEAAPAGYYPWFQIPGRHHADATIIFGHWAALGLHIRPNLLGLDSGCVYGRCLTAIRLEDRKLFQVAYADSPSRG